MNYFCCAVVISCLIYQSNGSLIKIEDNGYSGIVVGFSHKNNTDKKVLLQNLENVFSEASKVLYEITNHHAYFKEITFLIPKSWGEVNNWKNPEEIITVEEMGLERYNDADIFVESEAGVFGNHPYTIQVSGCEYQGHEIHLTEMYLQNRNDNHLKARDLVYEWLKYRYGVFDEHGFQDDERYPILHGIPGNLTLRKLTSCTNQLVEYSDDDCSINSNTGRMNDPTCIVHIKEQEPTIESSSFMFSSKFNKLCGSDQAYAHDVDSLTKHNTLCFEKSIFEIISRHKDLRSKTLLENSTTVFRYVQESPLRLVLAIDITKDSPDNIITTLLKKVVSKFIMFTIPRDSSVDLVMYTLNDTHMRRVENFDKPTFVNTGEIGHGCIQCALLKSIEILEKYKQIKGSILVLIARRPLNNAELRILKDAESKNIRIFVILYLPDRLPVNQLQHEGDEKRIRIQYVPMKMKETESLLYGSLRSSVHDYVFSTAEDSIMIMQESFMESTYDINFAFPVDKTTQKDLTILFSLSDVSQLYDTELKVSINDKVYSNDGDIIKFEDLAIGGLKVLKFASIEVGNVKVSIKKDPDVAVHVTVFAKESSHSSAIIVRCWLSIKDQFIEVHENSEPVILYTEVRSGNLPVKNAKVTAFLLHPDKSHTTFTLTDDGIGDPDITKDDGIYTRYITGFSMEGYYILNVSVTDGNLAEIISGTGKDKKCCGSFVPAGKSRNTGMFSRLYYYGGFYVSFSGTLENKDFYPPSRITDFNIINVNGTFGNATVPYWRYYLTFSFSAPGGNYNNDKATKYDVKYFRNRPNNETFSKGISPSDYQYHNRLPFPGNYGEKQRFTLEISETELRDLEAPYDVVFFAIRAVDHNNKEGKISNIVEAYLPILSPPTEESTMSTTIKAGQNNKVTDFLKDDSQESNSAKVGLIAGIIIACLILIIAVALAVFIFKRKRSRKSKEGEISLENNKPEKSSDYLSDDNLRVPKSDPISPIQSWPANVLLDHYNKIQEAKRKDSSDDGDGTDSSSGDSSHPLKPNPIYEETTDDRRNEKNKYLPSAPLASSQNSLNSIPRHVTQV